MVISRLDNIVPMFDERWDPCDQSVRLLEPLHGNIAIYWLQYIG